MCLISTRQTRSGQDQVMSSFLINNNTNRVTLFFWNRRDTWSQLNDKARLAKAKKKKTKRHNCICVRNFVSRIFHLGACSIRTLLVAEGQGFFLPEAQHGQ